MTEPVLVATDRPAVRELAPLLQRTADLDPRTIVRLRLTTDRATVFVRLPFDVLVARAVASGRNDELDAVAYAVDVLAWLDGGPTPPDHDRDWRSGLPPLAGWRRLDTVPDSTIRPLVRQGSLTLKEAAAREGVPGAQPRAEVADALLDSVVLTAEDGDGAGGRAEVTLRQFSALTRMGFLRKDGFAHIDAAGRWLRVVGEFGTVYRERPGGLGLL